MQGVLYFPQIAVPSSTWLLQTLLYWDTVATITPNAYAMDPDQHDRFTRDLIREGLVLQVFPSDVPASTSEQFRHYLGHLDDEELARRRAAFESGAMARIHVDKLMYYMGDDFSDIRWLGLGRRAPYHDDSGFWYTIEPTTAREFMAGLAIALCKEDSRWTVERRRQNLESSWIPISDDAASVDALMAGLRPARPDTEYDDRIRRRVGGERRVAEIRTSFLNRVLPVPLDPFDISKLMRFKQRHGDLLPQLRRTLEDHFDSAVAEADGTRQFQRIDRLVEEVDEQIVEAERYLKRAGMRRLARSSVVKWLKFIPGLHDPVENLQDLAGNTRSSIDKSGLAYLAFARVELAPPQHYRVDPMSGIPLIEVFGR